MTFVRGSRCSSLSDDEARVPPCAVHETVHVHVSSASISLGLEMCEFLSSNSQTYSGWGPGSPKSGESSLGMASRAMEGIEC